MLSEMEVIDGPLLLLCSQLAEHRGKGSLLLVEWNEIELGKDTTKNVKTQEESAV